MFEVLEKKNENKKMYALFLNTLNHIKSMS